MKKTFLITLIALNIASAVKAQTVNIFYENKKQGHIIYAGNSEFYPVSISLNLELTNLVFSEGEATIFVIPPKSNKFKIGELTIMENGKRYNSSYTYKSAMGDVTISNYDKSFEYDLPFQKGKSFSVNQGYNGSFSHQNENAIDFTMPEGTEILAARDGIVVQVVQNNTESCAKETCKKYNNYITIMHPDGTFAYYAHIKYNGSKYKTGDAVKKGDIIAYSGNVGFTAGPHLHFSCFLPGFEKWKSIETKFRIDKADKVVALKEGNTYLRDY
jgi:murein DD-endopeptidase MepM/ murein hydrolase activator NlpD